MKTKKFTEDYFDKLIRILRGIEKKSIDEAVRVIHKAHQNGNSIFLIGNGGSASTSSHIANDFCKGIKTGQKKPFKAISLTDNVSLITAIGNDEDYSRIFVDQLKVLMKQGDVLVAISASGNSSNILNAVKYAKENGGKTIGFVGFDGGKLKGMADVCIHAKSPLGWYGPVEDIHLVMGHVITGFFKENFEKI